MISEFGGAPIPVRRDACRRVLGFPPLAGFIRAGGILLIGDTPGTGATIPATDLATNNARAVERRPASIPLSTGPPASAPRRVERFALTLVVLAALGLRVSAVGFGKGALAFQVDENFNVPLALRMSWTDLNPHYFQYPALLWDLLFGLDRLAFWILREFGLVPTWTAFGELFQRTPIPFFLLGRTISVLAGTAAVGAVFFLGARLFGRGPGLLAAAFLAGTFLHVRDSALATPDALTSLCVVVSLLGSAAVLTRGRWRDYALAGLGAGLAASAKYHAGIVLLAVVVAHALSPAGKGTPFHRILVRPRVLGAIFLAGVVFLALNPYLLLDPARAGADLLALALRVRDGQCINGCLDAGLGWWYHLALSLRYGMGRALVGLALLGALLAVARREGAGWVLLGFVLPFYALLGPTHLVFVRYMTPVLPALCLLAARGTWGLATWLRHPRLRVAALAGLGLLALAEPLSATAAYIKMVRRPDTRVEVYELLRRLPPGTPIASYGPHEVWDSTTPRPDVRMAPKREDETWAAYVARLRADGVEYLLAHHSALEVFSPSVPDLDQALRESALLAWDISPYEPGAADPRPVYDWLDPYYFPIGGFGGVRRSGPLVRIYRLH